MDDHVYRVAKKLAHERQHTLGRVLSDLMLQALRSAGRIATRRIPVLQRKGGGKPVTSRHVKDLLESDLIEVDQRL